MKKKSLKQIPTEAEQFEILDEVLRTNEDSWSDQQDGDLIKLFLESEIDSDIKLKWMFKQYRDRSRENNAANNFIAQLQQQVRQSDTAKLNY